MILGAVTAMMSKGGSPKKLPLSLVGTASAIMQTSVPECQKIAFLKIQALKKNF